MGALEAHAPPSYMSLVKYSKTVPNTSFSHKIENVSREESVPSSSRPFLCWEELTLFTCTPPLMCTANPEWLRRWVRQNHNHEHVKYQNVKHMKVNSSWMRWLDFLRIFCYYLNAKYLHAIGPNHDMWRLQVRNVARANNSSLQCCRRCFLIISSKYSGWRN